jgi:protein-tyrosine phosphatase
MPEILFVCTANQFRSPIAAACFARKLKENSIPGSWTVTSSGTWTRAGCSAHTAAIKEATRLGLDLSQHRSREVNAVILEDADLVVVMENSHREALAIEFPQVDRKVALLTELAGDVPVDVIDPFHSAFEDSAEVADALVQYVDSAFENILTKASANYLMRLANGRI